MIRTRLFGGGIAALAVAGALLAVPAAPVAAVGADFNPCDATGGMATSDLCKNASRTDANNFVKNIVNLLLWLVGVLAVLMIVWSGVMYITSSGNSQKVGTAKNTLLYSVIGLLVAVLAGWIVNQVIDWGTNTPSPAEQNAEMLRT